MKKIKVIIVDDHPIVSEGLTKILGAEPDITVCAQARNENEALEAIAKHKPDLVVMDISLGSSDGIVILKKLRSQKNMVPVLILSMYDQPFYVYKALNSGANGFLSKSNTAESIVKAVRTIISGKIYIDDTLKDQFIHQFVVDNKSSLTKKIELLSDKERIIFSYLGEKHSVKQISNILHISVKTVETHINRMRKKLNIKTTKELRNIAERFCQKLP